MLLCRAVGPARYLPEHARDGEVGRQELLLLLLAAAHHLHVADEEGDDVDGEVHDDGHGQVRRARVRRAEAHARERGGDHVHGRGSVRVEHAEEDRLRRDRKGDARAGRYAERGERAGCEGLQQAAKCQLLAECRARREQDRRGRRAERREPAAQCVEADGLGGLRDLAQRAQRRDPLERQQAECEERQRPQQPDVDHEAVDDAEGGAEQVDSHEPAGNRQWQQRGRIERDEGHCPPGEAGKRHCESRCRRRRPCVLGWLQRWRGRGAEQEKPAPRRPVRQAHPPAARDHEPA
mmetsp:Transcript_12063/g.30091  ORF Transcript_12063/g.30091 Transcript_12063/m.30091 type:complete len:293 (-) Transcript_12063:119-997(-)